MVMLRRVQRSHSKLVAWLCLLLWLTPQLVLAQDSSSNWAHMHKSGTVAPSNAPFVTSALDSTLTGERALRSQTPFITITDNGANDYLDLNIAGQLGIANGGTGASTAQGALNATHNLAGLATGDIVIYDGANWSLKHKGANGTFLGVSGGVVDYYAGTGGTVTSVSSGNLTNFATVSIATATTTPAFSFTLTQAPAHKYFGNNTGSAAAPDYLAIAAADLPAISLTSGVTGTLPIANGGTGQTTASGAFDALSPLTTLGDVLYGGTAGADTRLAGNTTTTKKFLTQTGDGAASAAPGWNTIVSGDVPAINLAAGGNGGVTGTTPIANGGTGQTSAAAAFDALSPMTTNGDLVTRAAGTGSRVGIGSTGQYLKVVSGAPAWAAGSNGFGGDGLDGALSWNTQTITAPKQYNATTVTINASQTITVNNSPLIINCTSTFTNSGTLTMTAGNGGAGGGLATYGGDGMGQGAGMGSTYVAGVIAAAGGGGGNGGAGGYGGGSAGNYRGLGGPAYTVFPPYGGSGGGGSPGGVGGGGGSALRILAVGAIANQTGKAINCKGAAGADGSSGNGAAGGGAGGSVEFISVTSTDNSGTIDISGGNGGAGQTANSAGGGGGGGGKFLEWSPSNSNTGTVTATGGTGGTGITNESGANGSTGTTTTLTGTPNFPLLGWYDHGGASDVERWCLAHNTRVVNNREILRLAARGDVLKWCEYACERRLFAWQEQTYYGAGCFDEVSEAVKNAS